MRTISKVGDTRGLADAMTLLEGLDPAALAVLLVRCRSYLTLWILCVASPRQMSCACYQVQCFDACCRGHDCSGIWFCTLARRSLKLAHKSCSGSVERDCQPTMYVSVAYTGISGLCRYDERRRVLIWCFAWDISECAI
jgi:hypothetical protein